MENKTNINFIFFALAPTGTGISGSDRIFIELTREWSKKIPITIFTTFEGDEMIKRQRLAGKFLEIKVIGKIKLPRTFLIKYFYKVYLGIRLGFSLPTTDYRLPTTYLYSSSDFWMDVFPAVIIKIRFNKLKWIATWFQTAPNPFVGYKEQGIRNKGYLLSAFFYWVSQLVSKPLITKFADKVIVNNEDERKRFPKHTKHGHTIVLLGAVPFDDIQKFLTTNYQPLATKKYDAVFQGRFHPQKGVVELIDIWKKVVEKKPDAKLAMIGDGPLMMEVKKRITMNKLIKNVSLFGYVFDGPDKYKIFAESRVVVHPAFYDSGGMAAAEAMAFGLPAVGFNLKSYESYYPKGMIKVKTGDLKAFAKTILRLLQKDKLRQKIGSEAREMIERSWTWTNRANQILNQI